MLISLEVQFLFTHVAHLSSVYHNSLLFEADENIPSLVFMTRSFQKIISVIFYLVNHPYSSFNDHQVHILFTHMVHLFA